MEKFNVGDRVKLREDSEYAHQSDGQDGTIIELDGCSEYCYRITWGNGYSDSYRAIDIELVTGFISLVDKYIVVYDEEDGEAFYQVVEDVGCFDDDGSRYVKVIGVDFNKVVLTTPVNVMIDNGNERTYGFQITQRIAWLNRVLTKSAYINFADWSETMSEEDKLIIKCLQRYPNLKVGEKFGFSNYHDSIVKELHPRNWTVTPTTDGDCEIYLAKCGEGGAKVYSNKQWAERTSVTSVSEKMIITSDRKVDYGVVEDSSSFRLIIDQPIEKTSLLNRKSKIKQLKLN